MIVAVAMTVSPTPTLPHKGGGEKERRWRDLHGKGTGLTINHIS